MAGLVYRQNGPDLRRDYDGLALYTHPWPGINVRMDLIYEGITTWIGYLLYILDTVRMDLIYEGITTLNQEGGVSWKLVRMDLIYEGITTSLITSLIQSIWQRQNGPDLRRDYDLWCIDALLSPLVVRQNGPDLRRDYDEELDVFTLEADSVRMDLIYEGITTESLAL